MTEWKRSEELLRALAEGTAGVTGREFFRSLARHAAKALAVRYAFLAECLAGDRARGVLFFMAAARGAYGHLRCGLVEQVASAVAAALDDCLAHEELRRQSSQALTRSEERLRDLFDEAPIAYVHEGLDTRFIRANRAAMRSLAKFSRERCPPESVSTFCSQASRGRPTPRSVASSLCRHVYPPARSNAC